MRTSNLIDFCYDWYVRQPLIIAATALICWTIWHYWHRSPRPLAPRTQAIPRQVHPKFRPLQYLLLLLGYGLVATIALSIFTYDYGLGIDSGLDFGVTDWPVVVYTLSFFFFALHASLLTARRHLTLAAARVWGVFFLLAYWGILMAFQTRIMDDEFGLFQCIFWSVSAFIIYSGIRFWYILLWFLGCGLLSVVQLGIAQADIDSTTLILWFTGIFLAIPAWLRFAQPAEPLNLLPLALIYQMIAFASVLGFLAWLPIICSLILLAGWAMPRHRQLRALLRPARLPRRTRWLPQASVRGAAS